MFKILIVEDDRGIAEALRDGLVTDEAERHRYDEMIVSEIQRLSRLVNDLLELSSLQSNPAAFETEQIDPVESLYELYDRTKRLAESKGVRLTLTVPEYDVASVITNEDRLQQVLTILLDNAIKFTPAGGTIKFHVEKLGPEVEISIWNSGQGISPEALPYVFQRFYKEDRSRGLHARGAGLGLNICKVLVNLSGGQIRVESQQGEWCQFVFTLPATPPNPSGMKRLPDESGQPVPVEDPASMKPVN